MLRLIWIDSNWEYIDVEILERIIKGKGLLWWACTDGTHISRSSGS